MKFIGKAILKDPDMYLAKNPEETTGTREFYVVRLITSGNAIVIFDPLTGEKHIFGADQFREMFRTYTLTPLEELLYS